MAAKRRHPASKIGAARRSHLAPKVRGGDPEEPCQARGQGRQREEKTHAQGVVAVRAQEGLEETSHVEVRKGGGEETPFVQGKEQWLRFAGAAVKRYPMPKVRETQVRW